MHCPYCNSNLVDADDGGMLCSSSGALLSEPVSKVFRLRYSHCQTIAGAMRCGNLVIFLPWLWHPNEGNRMSIMRAIL